MAGGTGRDVWRFMRIPAALIYSSVCMKAGVRSVPPQALLAVEIEGVLCTAGMKAG